MNVISNLTIALGMRQQQDAWVAYLHIYVYIAGISLCHLPAFAQAAYSPSNFYSWSAYVLFSTEMSIPMLGNLYKHLMITTNALPSIRMACDCLQIRLEYAFLKNFRNMFLIFAKPRERPLVLTNINECQAITLQPLQLLANCHDNM